VSHYTSQKLTNIKKIGDFSPVYICHILISVLFSRKSEELCLLSAF